MKIFRLFRMGSWDGQVRAIDDSTLGMNINVGKNQWERYVLFDDEMIWQGRYHDLLGGVFGPNFPLTKKI